MVPVFIVRSVDSVLAEKQNVPSLPAKELRKNKGVFGEEEIYLRSLSAGHAGGR